MDFDFRGYKVSSNINSSPNNDGCSMFLFVICVALFAFWILDAFDKMDLQYKALVKRIEQLEK